MRRHVYLLSTLALLVSLLFLAREPASVLGFTVYIVNSTADPGVCWCDATECTLSEAITAANVDGGMSSIVFNIPTSDGGYNSSTGVWTIQLTSALPELTDDWTAIMGSTQADNHGDTNGYGPEIAVNGASTYNCFVLGSAHNTIEGLAVNECRNGIQIVGSGAHHNNISGNYIGLDAHGSVASGNTESGIYIGNASDNTIGGDTANARNIISGNAWRGVDIYGAGADRNLVKNNYIGTDASGRVDVGNAWNGVQIDGGAQDNKIGPDNIIAYNGGAVLISGSGTISNTITQNSIHSSLWGGITLSGEANDKMLPPQITAASCTSAIGTAPEGYWIELFSDYEDEGRQFHGSEQAIEGNVWMVSLPSGMFSYPNLTATATDGSGNTSEFSDWEPSGCLFSYLPLTMKGY
jgi:hypothetical protein